MCRVPEIGKAHVGGAGGGRAIGPGPQLPVQSRPWPGGIGGGKGGGEKRGGVTLHVR